MEIAQVTQKIPQSTGQWDVTVSGFGTPDAVLMFTGGYVDGAGANSFRHCFGVFDGTTQYCVVGGVEDNESTASSRKCRIEVLAKLIGITVDFSYDAVVAATSFITDGVRLNVENAPGSSDHDSYCTFLLFKGVTATAGKFTGAAAVDGTVQVPVNSGMTPTLIAGAYGYAPLSSSFARGQASIGFAVDTGLAIKHAYCGLYARPNINPTRISSYSGKNSGFAARQHENGMDGYLECSAMDQGSFTAKTKAGDMSGGDTVFLALDTGNTNLDIFDVVFPTASGDWDPFTAGFQPGGLIMGLHSSENYDTLETLDPGASFYFAVDGDEEAYHASVCKDAHPDGTACPAESDYSSSECRIVDDELTDLGSFGSPTFDSDGVEFADANVDHGSFAYKGWALAIGSDALPIIDLVEDDEGDQQFYEGQGDVVITGNSFNSP